MIKPYCPNIWIVTAVQILFFFTEHFDFTVESDYSKTFKKTCEPSMDSGQSAHMRRQIRAFAGCTMGSQGPSPSSC